MHITDKERIGHLPLLNLNIRYEVNNIKCYFVLNAKLFLYIQRRINANTSFRKLSFNRILFISATLLNKSEVLGLDS